MDTDEDEGPFTHTEQRSCPAWCYECLHGLGPDGAFWHKSEATTIDVYREWDGTVLVPLAVQAEHLDKLPEDRNCGNDVPDMEEPIIRLEIDGDNFGLHLTPQRARQLAAALLATADAIESTHPLPQQSGVS